MRATRTTKALKISPQNLKELLNIRRFARNISLSRLLYAFGWGIMRGL